MISAIPFGMGSHDLFPPVISPYRIFKNRCRALLTYEMAEMPQKILQKIYRKFHNKRSRKNNERSRLGNIDFFLHEPNVEIQLPEGQSMFFDNFENCINEIRKVTQNRSIKVGFYQASSLTFPI